MRKNTATTTILLLIVSIIFASCTKKENEKIIQKNEIEVADSLMTPEALWAMGRIGGYAASPDGKHIAYNVAYYSVEENKSHHIIYVMDADGSNQKQLTTTEKNETDVAWLDDSHLSFISDGEVWKMNINGSHRKQLTKTDGEIEGYLFSPDKSKVILIKSIPYYGSIKERPDDLPKSTGRVITDLMYRHWDHYVETIPHPFIAEVTKNGIGEAKDILEGEPYECPMEPFGGIEQLAWSPDSKFIAFTCRCLTGVDYSISTDSDIFLYDVEACDLNSYEHTKNLCKGGEFGVVPDGGFTDSPDGICNPTKTFKYQFINTKLKHYNVGYDTNPKFSPDGRYVAWLSMERDGYESDRNRLCIYDLKENTKSYVTESFDSSVDDYCWTADSNTLYFIGVWHAMENLYRTNLKGDVEQLTDGHASAEYFGDFGSLQMLGDKQILAERHSYFAPADLYTVIPGDSITPTKWGLLLGTTPQTRIGNRQNLFYKNRIDAAVQLYKAGKIEKILVSGAEKSLEGVNEVVCMRDSLVARGVDAGAIVLDGKGNRTLESVVRAVNVYGIHRFIVISQRFHNERAIYQAEHLDLDVNGITGFNADDVHTSTSFLIYLREYLARVKMFLDLFLA